LPNGCTCRDPGDGYVTIKFFQINAAIAGQFSAKVKSDIASRIFLAALSQNQICVAVKFKEHRHIQKQFDPGGKKTQWTGKGSRAALPPCTKPLQTKTLPPTPLYCNFSLNAKRSRLGCFSLFS